MAFDGSSNDPSAAAAAAAAAMAMQRRHPSDLLDHEYADVGAGHDDATMMKRDPSLMAVEAGDHFSGNIMRNDTEPRPSPVFVSRGVRYKCLL
jgi:hypothetical protein